MGSRNFGKEKIRNFEKKKEMRNCGQYIELTRVLHIPHNSKGFTLCFVTFPAVAIDKDEFL